MTFYIIYLRVLTNHQLSFLPDFLYLFGQVAWVVTGEDPRGVGGVDADGVDAQVSDGVGQRLKLGRIGGGRRDIRDIGI